MIGKIWYKISPNRLLLFVLVVSLVCVSVSLSYYNNVKNFVVSQQSNGDGNIASAATVAYTNLNDLLAPIVFLIIFSILGIALWLFMWGRGSSGSSASKNVDDYFGGDMPSTTTTTTTTSEDTSDYYFL